MVVTIKDSIDNDHRSHYWYGGQCATIEHNGYVASIEAIGDIYVEYAPNGEYKYHVKDKNNAGYLYGEICNDIKNDKELYDAIDKGDLIVDNNNWWECFIYDPQGNFHDLMWALDSDYLDDAIREVKFNLENVIKQIEERATMNKEEFHQYVLAECERQWHENQEETYGTWESQSDDTKAEYYNDMYQHLKFRNDCEEN